MPPFQETDLYAPVKAYLEKQGYEVKAEIGAADIVARRGEDDPLVVELKTGFTLSLFQQAVERQALTETVYVAVPRITTKRFRAALKANKKLCRRLGLGLITVRMKDGFVEVHCDPAPYRPRISKPRRGRLLREFERRVGDPNTGGSTRRKIVTAYRQDAITCLTYLHKKGPTKASIVANETGVDRARRIMADDHYGWFERVTVGIYQATPAGRKAVREYRDD